jgi:hypothetical protein
LDDSSTVTFYRIAKRFPPTLSEYRTKRQKDGDPPPDARADIARAYDGLSVFDTEAAAVRHAKRMPVLGTIVIRFHIPTNGGIMWEQTFRPGHYTLYGDLKALATYLDHSYVVSIR